MEQITKQDLILINELSSQIFPEKSFGKKISKEKQDDFNIVKAKLFKIAKDLREKYNSDFGFFDVSISPERNPITKGKRMHGVWSSFYKGSPNKQYAAQISFVIHPSKPCLQVGFYFGSASSRSIEDNIKDEYELNLSKLGIDLSKAILENSEFRNKYNSIFDIGFTPYFNDNETIPLFWAKSIRENATKAKLIVEIFPNKEGYIENSLIDFYVSQIIFIMGVISSYGIKKVNTQLKLPPLTPKQRAHEAERLTEIGLKGEIFILEHEKKKLKSLGIEDKNYPRHIALESSYDGYDILSLDEFKNEIYIEVKSTTRNQNDEMSKMFFLTNNEFQVFEKNKGKYFIYRVYSVENNPNFEILNFEDLDKMPNGYIIKY